MRKAVAAVSLVLGVALMAFAERPTEPVTRADYVVVGQVTKVFHHDFWSQDQYVIQIRIEAVEKGDDYREGDFIYAYAFQRKPNVKGDETSARGHTSIPEEGQRIRARIKRGRGEMEALYPEWFEVLEKEKRRRP